MYSIGIVGLPNAGKSTLFKALTQKEVAISPRPFTTIDPNKALAEIKDETLIELAKILKPQKITFPILEFVDIAGLIKGAHKGEGLGNEFLSHLKGCNLKLLVLRVFDLLEEANPQEELKVLTQELKFKDLQVLTNNLTKLQREATFKKELLEKVEVLEKLKKILTKEESLEVIENSLLPEEKEKIKEFQFLTLKPSIYLLNVKEGNFNPQLLTSLNLPPEKTLVLDCKLELEIQQMDPSERKDFEDLSHLDLLIKTCYNGLDLITFYTIKGLKEAKAWLVKRATKVIEAAEVVHSDFAKHFKKAEVIKAEELIRAKSLTKAKEKGLVKVVGKDYPLEGGEVLEFKI